MNPSSGYDEYALIANLYDYVAPYRDRPDVGFFVEAARSAGSPVLEVGCGTGRVLIPTARAGVDIVGLDLSPRMLTVCRQRLEGESEAVQNRVRLVQADMRDFDLGQRFTLATIPFRPFQHLLTVETNSRALRAFGAHPDGRQEHLVHAFPLRYLFRFEAEHLLARAGFHVEHLYADYDKSAYGSKYPGELLLVARKTSG